MKLLIFVCFTALARAQDNRPWPVGSGPQQPNQGIGPNPSFNSGATWNNNPNQPPVGGGAPFGQNLPGQNSQQGWMAGSNPQFNSGANPQFQTQFGNPVPGSQLQPQHNNAVQPVGFLPGNNPPPGSGGASADRAAGSSNPQWGSSNPQFGINSQPNWNQPGQPGQPFQQVQPGWNQPGGQQNWNNPNNPNNPNDPRFGNPNNPGQPGNPNNQNWNNPNNPGQSTPYPIQNGRPWGGATRQFSYSFFSLVALVCLMRFVA